LWTALRDLDLNDGIFDFWVEPDGRAEGGRTVLAMVDGVGIVTGVPRGGELRVRLGRRANDCMDLAPGPTLGEDMKEQGTKYGYELLQLEVQRCRRWIEADQHLGAVALCGPASWRVYKDVRYERDAGYLGARNEMTAAGWWRLAYLAGQGVGLMDRRREQHLRRLTTAPRPGEPKDAWQQRRPHLRGVQRMVFERMAREEVIPLGIEFSPMHDYIVQRHGLLLSQLLPAA